jgi:hypothetical protein
MVTMFSAFASSSWARTVLRSGASFARFGAAEAFAARLGAAVFFAFSVRVYVLS